MLSLKPILFITILSVSLACQSSSSKYVAKGPYTKDVPAKCLEERKIGKCKALFKVYGFSSVTGQCVEYVYGGCEGTANRFETKIECEAECVDLSRL